MVKEMSAFDAFLALKDIDDEEIKIPASRHEKLKEGKSFDVRDDRAMDAAQKFNEEQTKEDVVLEVVDTNADSEAHLLNNSSYVGQRILQCERCRGNRFVNMEDLDKQPDGSYKVKENVNIGISNECPHCHASDVSYKSIGDVAAVPEEKPAEATFDNDQPKDEATFDNDMTSTEQEGEPAVPEQPAEETKPEEPAADEGGAWDDTPEEDDTVDMRDTTGDVIDSDDVKADDTEEEFPWDNDEEPSKIEDDILFDDEDKKEKKESLNEELTGSLDTAYDLFDTIIEPQNITRLTVLDTDGNTILDGEVPADLDSPLIAHWIDSDLLSWGVLEGSLTINISNNSDSGITVEDALNLLDDETDNIQVWDDDLGDYVFEGNKEEVIEEYGQAVIESFEAPEMLSISVDAEAEAQDKEDEEPEEWYESLSRKVCEANGLRFYRADKEGTQEYWVTESIKNKEDLDVIYEHFLQNICSEEVVNEFKESTGFMTEADKILNEQFLIEEASEVYDFAEAQKWAKGISQEEDCDVIFGYNRNGKFYRLTKPYKCKTDNELKFASENVKTRFKPTGSIATWFKRNNDIDLDECADKTTEDCHCEGDIHVVKEGVRSFKTRNALALAIKECKNNNQPYKVKKSMTEGYRYDLIVESTEDDDYVKEAKAFVNEIHGMDLEEVQDCLDDYNFEGKAPEDEVEDMIWKALKDRKAELEKPVDESLNEDTEPEDEEDVLDLPVEDETETVVSNPADLEIVNKLVRIAKDISDAIRDNYGVEADERLILVDLIQDLRLISGDIRPEDLTNTPINELTKAMYAMYNGFTNLIGDEPNGRKLEMAVRSLDGPSFTTEAIKDQIASDNFLTCVNAGRIPFVGRNLQRIGTSEEEE